MILYAASIVSALLMWAAFPPLGWGLLAFIAPAPFLWALRRAESGSTALALGFTYGAVFFGLLLSWILVLGAVAWIPLTLWLGAMFAAYGLFVWTFRLWPPTRWWLITVGGWGLWELVRSYFPWGGFPWGSVGYAAAGNPGIIGSVQWVGPLGWSVLAVGVAAGLVMVIEDTSRWRLLVDPLMVVLLLAMAGGLFPPRADGDVVRVAIVQGSSPCPMTRCQNENQRILDQHLSLTRAIPADQVDLVVWGENSFGTPFDPTTNKDVAEAIKAQARRIGAYILVSGTEVIDSTSFVNSNIVYSPIGTEVGRYDKRHPVPYGEFVPLRGVLGFIPQLDQVPRDMIPGTGDVVFRLRDGTLGSVISFEGAFVRYIRSEVRAGAQLMVVATNESSYGGDAPASDQLIGLTRVNAAAVGEDLIHAAITGRSAFISADGTVGPETNLLDERFLLGEVRYRTAGPTLFTKFGEWVLLIAIAGAFAGVATPGVGRPEGGLRRRRG